MSWSATSPTAWPSCTPARSSSRSDTAGLRPALAPLQPGLARGLPLDPRPEAESCTASRAARRTWPTAAGMPFEPRCGQAMAACATVDARALPNRRDRGPLPRCAPAGRAIAHVGERLLEPAPLLETHALTRHFRVGGLLSRQARCTPSTTSTCDRPARDRRAGRRERQRQEHGRAAAGDGLPPDQRPDRLRGPVDRHCDRRATAGAIGCRCRWSSRTPSARSTRLSGRPRRCCARSSCTARSCSARERRRGERGA